MIECRGICKSYERPGEPRLDVLKSVDLNIEPGEFTAVVGPSGSGKSTLMNILGLLDRPDSGNYLLGGEPVSNLPHARLASLRNKKIGFVFQQFHLLPRTTALENVELPLVYADTDNISDRAAQALCRVGLQDRMTHTPAELSGGQQQRVAIARALVNDPEIILADEPTGNLDRESGAGIMALFQELNESGRTIIFITHDAALAARAGRVLTMNEGILAEEPAQPVGGVA
ncbi:MAG: ABC transporter ATP-binding protein [Acidobacteriota bacterium]|nr:ABC transporter ATP-binding protein [Acidobacteriota bacterium]